MKNETAPATPLDRNARVEYLRELQAKLAALPAAAGPELPCPQCAVPMEVTLGRNSGVWIIRHPGTRGCALSGDLWRVIAADRQACCSEFGRLLESEEGE